MFRSFPHRFGKYSTQSHNIAIGKNDQSINRQWSPLDLADLNTRKRNHISCKQWGFIQDIFARLAKVQDIQDIPRPPQEVHASEDIPSYVPPHSLEKTNNNDWIGSIHDRQQLGSIFQYWTLSLPGFTSTQSQSIIWIEMARGFSSLTFLPGPAFPRAQGSMQTDPAPLVKLGL